MVFYAFQQFHVYDHISAGKVDRDITISNPKRSGDLPKVKHKSTASLRLEPSVLSSTAVFSGFAMPIEHQPQRGQILWENQEG